MQKYRVYRHVHFHRIQECLYTDRDYSWGQRTIVERRKEIQDLECRMCLERITDDAPRFVPRRLAEASSKHDITKIQFQKAFVFSEGASDCKDFSVSDTMAVGEARAKALQNSGSAQRIHENGTVNITTIEFGRSLIAS
jgi:hypothetical protein